MKSEFGVLVLAILLGGCAASTPTSNAIDASSASSQDLACPLPTNCVNSLGTDGLRPLPYAATPAQALEMLRATLATFPEATVVRAEPLTVELILTTPIGFRDQIDFRINVEEQRIDFRSRSQFGLFDFGKNRSRMQEFATRFEQQSRR